VHCRLMVHTIKWRDPSRETVLDISVSHDLVPLLGFFCDAVFARLIASKQGVGELLLDLGTLSKIRVCPCMQLVAHMDSGKKRCTSAVPRVQLRLTLVNVSLKAIVQAPHESSQQADADESESQGNDITREHTGDIRGVLERNPIRLKLINK
jgi:hypothetical protein